MFERLKELLKNLMVSLFGINKQYNIWSMETMLIHQVKNGKQDAVEKLIKKGADLNLTDSNGKTALMYAAENSNDVMVDLLLGRGANLEIRDNNGKTALDYGFSGNNKKVIDLLEGRVELQSIHTINPWEKADQEVSSEELNKQREEVVKRPIIEAKENEEKIKNEQKLDFSDLSIDDNKEKVNERVAAEVYDPWSDETTKEPEVKIERKEQTIEDLKQDEIDREKLRKLEKEMTFNPFKDEGKKDRDMP